MDNSFWNIGDYNKYGSLTNQLNSVKSLEIKCTYK